MRSVASTPSARDAYCTTHRNRGRGEAARTHRQRHTSWRPSALSGHTPHVQHAAAADEACRPALRRRSPCTFARRAAAPPGSQSPPAAPRAARRGAAPPPSSGTAPWGRSCWARAGATPATQAYAHAATRARDRATLRLAPGSRVRCVARLADRHRKGAAPTLQPVTSTGCSSRGSPRSATTCHAAASTGQARQGKAMPCAHELTQTYRLFLLPSHLLT